MEKKRIQKIWLFLRHFFYNSSAITVIFIIAGVAGYLIYFKETGKPLVNTDNNIAILKHENPSIDNTAIADVQKQDKEDSSPVLKKKQVVLNLDWDIDEKDENPEPDLEILSEEFEEEVLRYTDAEKIKVESKGMETPGYVAFMSRPEGFEKGIPAIMKDIAGRYLETFSEAPRVTISLIVGGGVRGQQTFLRDPELGVISDSERARINNREKQ